MKPFFRRAALAALATSMMGGSAAAQALETCATINGQTYMGSSLNMLINVDLVAGDTITVTTADDSTFGIAIEQNGTGSGDFGVCNAAASPTVPGCSGFGFTAAASDVYLIESFPTTVTTAKAVDASATPYEFTLACSGSTGPGGSPSSTVGQGSLTSANAQSNAVGNAVGSAVSARNGGPSTTVTRNGLFLSASNMASQNGLNVWGSITAHNFEGDLDGDGVDLLVGFDTEIAQDTYLGLMLGYGEYDMEGSGGDVDVESPMLGAYIAGTMGTSLSYDAYLAVAKPDYSGIASFDATRVMAGVKLRGSYTLGSTQMTPYVGLSGFSEDQPGSVTVESMTGSIGIRADFTTGGAIQPYVSLGAGFSHFDDGAGNSGSYTAPEIGLGFAAPMDNGAFYMDVYGGQVADDVRNVSVSLGYALAF